MGITETQASSHLTVPGERGQAELAADLGITSGAATGLVDRLERQGIARRVAHPSDRRRVTVQLTEAGLVIVEETRQWLAASFRRVPESELVHVASVQSTMAADLRDESRAIAERNAESTV